MPEPRLLIIVRERSRFFLR